MMSDAINSFAKQFEFRPKLVNFNFEKSFSRFAVCGMGGSHLAADLLKTWSPPLDIIVHSDYGLPQASLGTGDNCLYIASSYSGNTEETIDSALLAIKRGLPLIIIATGGKLLDIASKHNVAHIQLPAAGIQPRSALGYSMKAMMCAMGLSGALDEATELANTLKPEYLQAHGKSLAERIAGRVPVIYASARNYSVAYNWKIKFNETGKIPAFFNVFPELNHNEMTGFDIKDASRSLSEKFYFVILRDSEDDPRIHKRMDVIAGLYRDRRLPVETVDMDKVAGTSKILQKIFSTLIVADWAAFYTAERLGLESEQVPMVEEFKKLIKQ